MADQPARGLAFASTFAAVLLLGLSSGVTPAAAASSSVGTLAFSTVDYPGADWTIAAGVNDYGQVVGTYHDIRGLHGFLLSRGVYSTLDVPGGVNGIHQTVTQAFGINNQGQIVGTYEDASNTIRSFLLSSGTYTSLDVCHLEDGTAAGSWYDTIFSPFGVHAMNNVGRKAGSEINNTNPTHIIKQFEGFSEGPTLTQFDCNLDWPGSVATEIFGINDAGQMVGYASFGPNPVSVRQVHGVIWSSTGQRSGFDFPGAANTWLRGISNSGRLVGFISLPHNGFTYATYGMLTDGAASARIQFPYAHNTWILGINNPLLFNRYNVVGAYQKAGELGPHGFIATVYPDGVAQP